MLYIHTITSGPLETNTYVVFSKLEKKAVVIDPSYGSAQHIHEFLLKNQLELEAIWLTHSHWDHIADADILQKTYSNNFLLPIYVHIFDEENVRDPGSDGLPLYFSVQPSVPTNLFRHGDILPLGKESFTVIHTPGHSPGSCCFVYEKIPVIFTGDTLFKGTHGNVSFPTSCPESMKSSLQTILSIGTNINYTIFPGHGDKTHLYEEKKWLEKYVC